jgi:glycosyltransferase involved in cell wall biosynthesis
VQVLPPPIRPPERLEHSSRADLNLPDGFLFLFLFDCFSVVERKNPRALLRAFSQAFSPNEGPVLVIKAINGDAQPGALEALRQMASDREDVVVFDRYYSAEAKNALLARCDCYVSLHRAEGLGLTMAEAMALGKPVIATGYSGNLSFMSRENSWLVDYQLRPIPPGCEPYPVGARWAEPDIEQAARFMREVFDRPDLAAHRARRGQQAIVTRHTPLAAGLPIKQRLGEIQTRAEWC